MINYLTITVSLRRWEPKMYVFFRLFNITCLGILYLLYQIWFLNIIQSISISKMGLKDLIENSILRMDLLSATPSFRTRKQPAYETILGGLLSIMVLGTFYYFLYLQMSDMLNKLTISYSSGLTDNVSSSSTINSFPFAISIDDVDLAVRPMNFIIHLYQIRIVKSSFGPPTMNTTPIKLNKCNQSDWANFGTNFDGQYKAFGFDKMLCIQNGQNISLSGYTGSDKYEFLSLRIEQCNRTKNADCDTSANINTFVSNHLTTNDYFKVKLFVVDTIITPSEDNPITKVLQKSIFLAFSDTMGTVGTIDMAQYQVKTDQSLLPFSNYETQKGIYIEDFNTNAVSLTSTKYINLGIFRSTKSMTITRTLGKIDAVLSYVGGLFSLIFTGIAFLFGSYSQYKYELYVAESTLTDNKGVREKADNMGFFTFIVYVAYDWLDTFGLAPSCLSRMKRIHQIRDQSCQQLDPVIMLKRIKHLEEICKVLVNENKQMCLYLSEPLNLDQAKRMRFRLNYYENVLSEMEENKNPNGIIEDPSEKNCDMFQNDLQNESGVKCLKQTQQQEQKQFSEDEQNQFMGKLIYEAIERIKQDNTEMANNIKGKMSKKMKNWIIASRKFNSVRNSIENDEQFEKKVELLSPDNIVKQQSSTNTLEVKKMKMRRNIKRAKV